MSDRTPIAIAIIIAATLLTLFIVGNIGIFVDGNLVGSDENIDLIAGNNMTVSAVPDPTNNTIRVTLNSIDTTSTAGSFSTTTIQVDDATVFATSSPTIDFGPGFDVGESPPGEGNVTLDFTEVSHEAVHDIGGGDTVEFIGVIRDEGSGLTRRRNLDFTGAGVTCTDNAGATSTVCDIPHDSINKTKATQETVNNSTAYQNDDDIFFSIGANETWVFDLVFRVAIKSASDMKMQWILPAGGNINWEYLAIRPGVGFVDGDFGIGALLVLVGFDDNIIVRATGTVRTAGTAGTVNFQWAQNTAVAEDTIIVAFYGGFSVNLVE